MANESITNLSWLLEQVARRLDEIAVGVRAEEERGESFDRSTKAIQEALLHALSATGGSKDLDTTKVIALLKARRDGETE